MRRDRNELYGVLDEARRAGKNFVG